MQWTINLVYTKMKKILIQSTNTDKKTFRNRDLITNTLRQFVNQNSTTDSFRSVFVGF